MIRLPGSLYFFRISTNSSLIRWGMVTGVRDAIRNAIGKVIQAVRPSIIYLPFKNDVHTDHQTVFKATCSCTKTFRYPFLKKVLMMETISETEFAPPLSGWTFAPNVFVDITKHFHQKIQIMNIYRSELGRHPFPRSVENMESLAKIRGVSAGCRFAEAFMLLKEIM